MRNREEDEFEMREEYDFSQGIPNPFTQKFNELNLVSLDADVKAMFPDSEAVNRALRLVMEDANKNRGFSKAS